MSTERFDKAALNWDEKPQRLALAAAVVAAMKENLPLSRQMTALEIGCGTGLLTCELAGLLGSIVAVDTSGGMLAVLADKIKARDLSNVRCRQLDLLSGQGLAPARFALVYSGMALHHIEDTGAFLAACFNHLEPSGILALADLVKEDGSFHDDMTGVHHCGFATDELALLAAAHGFAEIRFREAHCLAKSTADGRQVDYPVFLMTAVRP